MFPSIFFRKPNFIIIYTDSKKIFREFKHEMFGNIFRSMVRDFPWPSSFELKFQDYEIFYRSSVGKNVHHYIHELKRLSENSRNYFSTIFSKRKLFGIFFQSNGLQFSLSIIFSQNSYLQEIEKIRIFCVKTIFVMIHTVAKKTFQQFKK